MAWAVKHVKVNTVTVTGTFDPRIPIDQPGEEGDKRAHLGGRSRHWKKEKSAEENPHIIADDCLMVNVKRQGSASCPSSYKNDIV